MTEQPRDDAGRFHAERPRGVLLNLRVRPEQRERWRAAAEAEGVALSAWVRRVLDAASERPELAGGA